MSLFKQAGVKNRIVKKVSFWVLCVLCIFMLTVPASSAQADTAVRRPADANEKRRLISSSSRMIHEGGVDYFEVRKTYLVEE